MPYSKKIQCLLILLFLAVPLFSFAQTEESDKGTDCEKTVSEKVQKKYQEASSLYSKKQYNESTKILRQLVEDEPEYADPYFLLGMIAAKKENIASMQKNFLQVLALCPTYKNPYLYYYLGLLAYSNEDFTKAEQYYKRFFEVFDELNSPEFEHLYQDARNYQQWSSFLGKEYGNPIPFNPQPVKGLSTPRNETLPYISVDGQWAYYTGTAAEKNPEAVFEESVIEKLRLFCSQRQADGTFEAGYPLEFPFNTKDDEGYVTLTADNRLLYYTACKYEKEYFNCDIYYSEFKEGAWQPLQNAGRNINGITTWEAQPSLTPDGKWLYFASDRKGGYGGTDIWRVKRLPGGDWGRPENLGPEVNSAGNERSPFIHPDGSTLYFSSNGWQTLGGYDFFYKRLDDATSKQPVNLGYPINTEDDEVNICVSTSGKTAYFSSTKYKNTSDLDIFEFELYAKARPHPVILIKGKLVDENGEVSSGTISFRKDENLETMDFPVNPEDGSFVAAVRSDFSYMMIAKREGYAYDSKYLPEKKLQKDSLTIQMQIQPIVVGGSYQLNDITFETNSAELSNDARFVIDAFVDFLRENPTLYVVIQGHTDNIGDSKDNIALSNRRAQAVYDYLLLKRIRKERLEYKGYGASTPIASNNAEEGRALNRRTVFVITRK